MATPAGASPTPAFVQGAVLTTGTQTTSAAVNLGGAVAQGDLLVGWFAEYNAPGHVQVSDNVNGVWTRAPAALAFQNDTGDIALYYLPNAKAAPGGVAVTVSASAPAFFSAGVAEYSGVAVAGPLDQIATGRDIGTVVDTGATAPVGAGELVFSALVTGGNPGSVAGGGSQGVGFTPRAQTTTGSVFVQDIGSSAAGPQDGTATSLASTDWYAVTAVFLPASVGDTVLPTTPGGLHATSVATTNVSLAWSASSDDVAVRGYTVYRDGNAIGVTDPATLWFSDGTVGKRTSYTYTVDAFDGAGNHSTPPPGLRVATPLTSPAYVQGAAHSPGTRLTSTTLSLTAPVGLGDLLVGWFAQYDAAGPVNVSDNVNGAWTRVTSEKFQNGGGDLALYYVRFSRGAANGLTVTISASSATFLPATVAEYSGVRSFGALDQVMVGEGSGTAVDAGPTGLVQGGELVFSAVLTAGQPLTVSPGFNQGVPFLLEAHNGSQSATAEAILSSAAGAQNGRFTLARSDQWYSVVATFRPGRFCFIICI